MDPNLVCQQLKMQKRILYYIQSLQPCSKFGSMDFHIQEVSQQEKFSNLHKSSLNSSKLAIGTLEKSNVD